MESPVAAVCALLNAHEAKYLIIGAQAAALHGYVRNTNDIDVLIPENRENHQRVIDALAKLKDGAARELSPADFEANIVVKIADEYEIDVSTRAWKVSYEEAFPTHQVCQVEGVAIPFVDLPTLIQTKQTYREQDRLDVQLLKALLEKSALRNGEQAGLPRAARASLPKFLLHGIFGFTALALLAFTPWIFGVSRWVGPYGMYVACLLIFILGSGPLLHGLLLGERRVSRCYKLFAAFFSGYALAWIFSYTLARQLSLNIALGVITLWFIWTVGTSARALRRGHARTDLPGLAAFALYLASAGAFLWFVTLGHGGSVLGLLLGTAWIAAVLAEFFSARPLLPFLAATLFLTNVAGYFAADWLEHYLLTTKYLPLVGDLGSRSTRMLYAMPLWAVLYGLGFGAGLGITCYAAQRAQTPAALST